MIERGDAVPHVSVRRIDGTVFSYGDIWQRRNLLLVCLADAAPDTGREAAAYAANLAALERVFQDYETTAVVTRDRVPGVPSPSVLVADRWGEVVVAKAARDVAALPAMRDLVEWLRALAHACPECEGEAR